jgi:hypothetical protein
MLRRAVISRKVLLVLALSRQFWLCSVYFSVRNPFIVANCIEERASRLDGEVLAGVLFGEVVAFLDLKMSYRSRKAAVTWMLTTTSVWRR